MLPLISFKISWRLASSIRCRFSRRCVERIPAVAPALLAGGDDPAGTCTGDFAVIFAEPFFRDAACFLLFPPITDYPSQCDRPTTDGVRCRVFRFTVCWSSGRGIVRCENQAGGSCVCNHRVDIATVEPFSAVERSQLDEKREAHQFSAELAHQIDGGGRSPARGEQIVDDQDSFPHLDR